MPKYIETDALEESMRRRYCKPCQEAGKDYNGLCCRACWVDDTFDEIDRAPAADIEGVKHGYWIEYKYDGQMAIKCSVCGDNPGVIYTYRRCPECGAKMDAERKEEDDARSEKSD